MQFVGDNGCGCQSCSIPHLPRSFALNCERSGSATVYYYFIYLFIFMDTGNSVVMIYLVYFMDIHSCTY